jgi:hypothetical protein
MFKLSLGLFRQSFNTLLNNCNKASNVVNYESIRLSTTFYTRRQF